MNNSSVELLWLPVPADKRKSIKPQVSGTIKSIAEGVGGVLTFFLAKVISLHMLSIVSIIAIIGWIVTALRVKNGYIKQLEIAISKRQIDFEELNVDVQDAAMVKTIEETLSSDDDIKQLFALEIIEGLPLSSWQSTINRLFKDGSEDVRKRILSMAWDEEDIITDDDIIAAIHKNDAVSSEAIMVAGRRKMDSLTDELSTLLSNDDTEILAASLRHPMHVVECMLIGADCATLPSKVLWQLSKHPLTDSGLDAFLKDWDAAGTEL